MENFNYVVLEVINSKEVTMLLVVMLTDIFLGISKAFINKRLNSNIGITGLIKHTVVIILIVLMGIYAPLFELQVFYTGIVIFYIFQYLLSIIENLIKIGIPLPNFIIEKVLQIKDKEEFKKYENDDIIKEIKNNERIDKW